MQVISLMWLRTVINYQYRHGVSMFAAIEQLFKEGGVGRFYQGVTYALIQNPLSKFGSVAANEGSRALLLLARGHASPLLASVLGTILSMVWKVLLMPLETAKTILQVEGTEGFQLLLQKVRGGGWGVLFEGTAATLLATCSSHYPWFFVHNWLDHTLPPASEQDSGCVALRAAAVGLAAAAASDICSNALRVVKTVKQALSVHQASSYSYVEVVRRVLAEGGLGALVGRGLLTRLLANGLQSAIFTALWKLLPILAQRRRAAIRAAEPAEATEAE
mgnify:CR=1 FL=1